MAEDPRPVNYRYDDAATILLRLGFTLAGGGSGSHRLWRGSGADRKTVLVGLVDAGNGPMKPVYVKKMVQALRDAQLLPVEDVSDDMDE